MAGNIEDYEVNILDAAQGQAIVRDGRPDLAGDDGADQLFNIESLQFADQTLYLDGTNNPVFARNDLVTARVGAATTLSRLLDNDVNYDGDVLTIINVGNAQNGVVTLDVNGNPVFTAASLAPASFEYTVSDGRGSTSTATVTVNVTPENTASTPTLLVQAAQGNEDTAIPLAITAALTDTDGSESLAIRIENVPAGATLSAGNNLGNGVWTLSPAQLVGLTITPPANADADFTLVVNAISTENNGGATASTSANLAVTVNSVNDAPVIVSGGGNTPDRRSRAGEHHRRVHGCGHRRRRHRNQLFDRRRRGCEPRSPSMPAAVCFPSSRRLTLNRPRDVGQQQHLRRGGAGLRRRPHGRAVDHRVRTGRRRCAG